MDKQEEHDLLIEIATKQSTHETLLEDIKSRLPDERECQAHEEKIRTLEKLTWGALTAAVVATIKSFWKVL